MIKPLPALIACGWLLATPASAQIATQHPPVERLDTDHWKQWSNLEPGTADDAVLPAAGEAVFRYPDGPRGLYKHGFRTESDSTGDWQDTWGVRMDVRLPDDREATLTCAVKPFSAGGCGDAVESISRLRGAGWHTVTLPWQTFRFEQARTSFLKYIKELSVAVTLDGDGSARAALRNVCVIDAPNVALTTPAHGKSVRAGGTAEYPVTLSNCTDQPQAVALSFERRGWEATQPGGMEGDGRDVSVKITQSSDGQIVREENSADGGAQR